MGRFHPNAFFFCRKWETTFNEGKAVQKAEFLLSHVAQKHIAAATTTAPTSGDLGRTGGMLHHEHDSQRQKGDIFPNCFLACTGNQTSRERSYFICKCRRILKPSPVRAKSFQTCVPSRKPKAVYHTEGWMKRR